jgi:hypothetical protein
MKLNSKRIVLYILGILFIAIVGYLVTFYMSVIDTNDVKLEGYVFDEKTKKPIENVLVIINNDRYESDNGHKNYDEYLGHDKIKLYTDKNGYYSTVIKKSAFVYIDFEKEGYTRFTENGKFSSKTMNYKTYLNSTN